MIFIHSFIFKTAFPFRVAGEALSDSPSKRHDLLPRILIPPVRSQGVPQRGNGSGPSTCASVDQGVSSQRVGHPGSDVRSCFAAYEQRVQTSATVTSQYGEVAARH